MNSFPPDDDDFSDSKIESVSPENGGGWGITKDDGWSFYVPADSPVEPKVGMSCRMYPGGIGGAVRGLFLDGIRVHYRTQAEQKEHHEIQMYGADAADWLARWDGGRSVWTIEMGGLGPGYEQAIHIVAAEILRQMLAHKYDASLWQDESVWAVNLNEIEKAVHPIIDKLGISGAQWHAAMNIAAMLYRKGPRAVMTDERVKDRHIQVSRDFPSLAAST